MPTGIYKRKPFTEEHKRNLSEALKGKKGYKHTEEWKKKASERMKKNNPMWQLEARKKMSEIRKGIKFSEEAKRKMSEAHKGKPSPKKGKHLSKESKKRISRAQKGKKKPPFTKEHKENMGKAKLGSKNPQWQGGTSFEPYSIDWTETLKRSIRERDKYICQLCSKYGNTVHHKDYNKKNCNPNNLINLCGSCNVKVNANRNYWINYFKKYGL